MKFQTFQKIYVATGLLYGTGRHLSYTSQLEKESSWYKDKLHHAVRHPLLFSDKVFTGISNIVGGLVWWPVYICLDITEYQKHQLKIEEPPPFPYGWQYKYK
jgi:hypothetical protein